MHRREFLAKAGLLSAASSLTGACQTEDGQASGESRSATQKNTTTQQNGGDWQWVRDQFALAPDKIHMSAMLVSTHPRPVREAIDGYRRELNENPVPSLERQNDPRKDEVRTAAADYLGGTGQQIALTDSTTKGIAIVYHGLALEPGQEVLTTEHEYYATHESLRQVANRTGAQVRQIALFDRPEDIEEDQIVERIVQSITPSTRVIALTWVHSSTGLKLPLREITDAVDGINRNRSEEDRILVCVDGVHGFGVEDVTMDELGCDFFMAGCHKWLFGPRGTGIVWGRPQAWAALQPVVPSFIDDASWVAWVERTDPSGPTTAARMSPGGFKPFEHQWAMADAFAFHQQIGKSRVQERTHQLSRQLKEGLDDMPHVTLYTPLSDDLSAGIVCFDVGGMSSEAVVDHLGGQDIIATTTPYAVSYPRLTPSIYNTPGEIDQALGAIESLA